jgi:imidazolonepropionase-like amidohydrolase
MAEGIASGADAFRDAVRLRVKYGAGVIKVCATGGVLSLSDEVDTPQITQAEMDAIVDEAHRLRKKTAAHAHGAEGAKVAIRAGIDSIVRLVPRRRGAAHDEGARHVLRADALGGRVCGRPPVHPDVPAGNRGQGQGRP